MRCECRNLLDRSLGYGRYVRAQTFHVWYSSFPVIEQSRARWARPFLQRYLRYRPATRPPPLVAAVPWEHVMVEDQRIGARSEQFGQPHLRWYPLCINMIELVVLANRPTLRKRSDLRGHGLHFAPERYLALQQLIASG